MDKKGRDPHSVYKEMTEEEDVCYVETPTGLVKRYEPSKFSDNVDRRDEEDIE